MTALRPLTVSGTCLGLPQLQASVVVGLGQWLLLYCHASLRNKIRVRVQSTSAALKVTPEITLDVGNLNKNYNVGSLAYMTMNAINERTENY